MWRYCPPMLFLFVLMSAPFSETPKTIASDGSGGSADRSAMDGDDGDGWQVDDSDFEGMRTPMLAPNSRCEGGA